MAYIINLTNGTIIATIADGSIDVTSTSLTLIGKGFNNYGEMVAEDLVHMVEHFSAPTPPANAIRGQLWFDTTTNTVKVNISSIFGAPEWIQSGQAIVSGSTPNPGEFATGSLWYDSSDEYLNVSVDGSTFTRLKTIKVGTVTPAGANGEYGDVFYNTGDGEFRVLNPNYKERGNPEWELIGIKVSATDQAGLLDEGDLWYDINNQQVKTFIDNNPSNDPLVVGPLFPVDHDSVIEPARNVDNPTAQYIVNGDVVGLMTQAATIISSGTEYANFSMPLKRGLTIDGALGLAEATNGNPSWSTGAGTPEGSVVANVGSMYTDTDGGAGTTLYVKETGTGNTGWVAK